jgi:potassium-transporting ATPase ATP-binding subunit
MTIMSKHSPAELGLFAPDILKPALVQAVLKLNPKGLARNPVIFATAVVSALASLLVMRDAVVGAPTLSIGVQITVWLWATVLFANFAEAVAEGRGKARADAFRATKSSAKARVLADPTNRERFDWTDVDRLEPGQMILVVAGDLIPTDGEVIEGAASVNEAAITGESAPVIRESGGDRSSVTGGTTMVSDWLVVRVT